MNLVDRIKSHPQVLHTVEQAQKYRGIGPIVKHAYDHPLVYAVGSAVAKVSIGWMIYEYLHR